MCGLSGVAFSDVERVADPASQIRMRDTMTHRGPDDSGLFVRPGVALGSRRLSIIDLSEHGQMPMSTEDGRYHIAYNGEVYNFQELRAGLEAKGYRFRSDTDTEVVLKLYADEGPRMLNRLNGMFAAAIWDDAERELFLFRDRLGVKPLYYSVHEGNLYFASEEKALFAGGVPMRLDAGCLEELMCFRYVAGERTPYKGVYRLLPGHYLVWRRGRFSTRRWWNLGERALELRDQTAKDPVSWFKSYFDDSVRLRRISDVNVGVLLSGGLDSGSVAASLAEQSGEKLASFTVRFAEAGYDEGPLARSVAERWNLDYHELKVDPAELLTRLHAASYLNDEPLVHGNDLYLLAISQYAKSFVTVLLSGEGGDETLGGYVRYRPLRYPALLKASGFARPLLGALGVYKPRIKKLARFLSLGGLNQFILFNSCDVLPTDLSAIGMRPSGAHPYRERVLKEAAGVYGDDLARQAMYSDLHTFLCSILDRNDRMTMGASIECRVPFLDYRLVEGLASLPSEKFWADSASQSKPLLRRSVGRRLPDEILGHRKWGFAVPWGRYMREVPQLRSLVNSLPDSAIVGEGEFDRGKVSRVTQEFLSGNGEHESIVRQLMMLKVWHDARFEGEGRVVDFSPAPSPLTLQKVCAN